MKPYVKSILVSENCLSCYPCCGVSNSIPSFTTLDTFMSKFEEFGQQFITFINKIFINFSLIVHEKLLSIPDDKEEGFISIKIKIF